MYRFQPKNRDELYTIIKEIVTNQENNKNYFYGLKNIDVSLINDMSYLFSCYKYNKNSEINRKINWNDPRNDIALWNVNNVTNMSEMFYESHFNQSIRQWNVSQVTNMKSMFYDSHFNQNISHWDVSQVTNMNCMFAHSNFNQDISHWNVSNVDNMGSMFWSSSFNQPIGNWNVSNVINMSDMFFESSFNQDISNWDVSNVTDMEEMFAYSSFNHNLYTWINRLNSDVDLQYFNKDSPHEKRYESIKSIDDFTEKQLTPPIWLQWYKESNDREKFELLKLLKHRDKKFIETLNQLLKKEKIIDNNIFVESNKI